MVSLTPDQAQALWSAGGFIILSGLPEGSEFGIDGTYHVIRKFSGLQFVPPGLHLITWSPPTGESGPSTIPLRSCILRYFEPQERFVLRYNPTTEGVEHEEAAVISDDSLKALDTELAPYPFEGLEKWKALLTHVTPEVLDKVMGEGQGQGVRVIDGMIGIEGVEEEDVRLNTRAGRVDLEKEDKLKFPVVDPKRSWREGAVGEEITKYSQDKSWQMGHVVRSEGDDIHTILAYLQLSFIILLHLSSFSALQIYQRLLPLFTRSPSLLLIPTNHLPPTSSSASGLRRTYTALVETIAAQLSALPPNAFEGELPEMDLFYIDEIGHLRNNLASAGGASAGGSGDQRDQTEGLERAWENLRKAGKTWGWNIEPLAPTRTAHGPGGEESEEDEEEEEEEGEYAPQIVET